MNPFSRPINTIIIVLISILVIAGIIAGLQLSKRTVTIKPVGADYEVTLYEGTKASNKQLRTFNSTQELSLYDGYYCYVVNGEKYNSDETCFSVYNTDKTVEITPRLSDAYLDTILKGELGEINTTIQKSYGGMFDRYENITGKIVVDDSWYVGILKERVVNPGEIFDSYVYVLKKTNGVWVVAVKPTLVVSTVKYPEIPKEVANKANLILTQYVRSIDT